MTDVPVTGTMKDPVTELLQELCEESAIHAANITWPDMPLRTPTKTALINAALSGWTFALALNEQDPAMVHRLAAHIHVTPRDLTDPKRMAALFTKALDASS